jgi:hypothetical protein
MCWQESLKETTSLAVPGDLAWVPNLQTSATRGPSVHASTPWSGGRPKAGAGGLGLTDSAKCVEATVSGNGSFADGKCFKSGGDPTVPSSGTVVTAGTTSTGTLDQGGLSAQYCLDDHGVPYFTITNSSSSKTTYTLAGWVVHQGKCCAGGDANKKKEKNKRKETK